MTGGAGRVSRGLGACFCLSGLSLLWTTALITNFSFDLFGTEKFGLVYNDMARRLLRGDWTIDPGLIGFEAFVRDGRTYTYFGIFPALLRVPAVLSGAGDWTLARLSCVAALWIACFAAIRTAQAAFANPLPNRAERLLCAAAIVGAGFSGPVIYVLASAAIYHEAIFWACAGTMVFNWIVVRRSLGGSALTGVDFALLGFCAGCVLLTRVSCGAALYLGFGLLLGWTGVAALARGDVRGARAAVAGTLRRAWAGIVVATGFGLIELWVNQGRWGDPFTPVPYQYYAPIMADPHRLGVMLRHGSFDLVRAWMAALHYGLGIPVDAVFPELFAEHFDGVEDPGAVGLLCAPWVFACSAVGVRAVLAGRFRSGPLMPLMIANAAGGLVVLMVPGLCLRYTTDCWGFLTLTAAVGSGWLAQRVGRRAPGRWGTGALALAAAVIGVVVSHATLAGYKVNHDGTAPEARDWLSAEMRPQLCPASGSGAAERRAGVLPLGALGCPVSR